MDEINGILENIKIQMKKYEDARDIADQKFTEMVVAMVAVQYDLNKLNEWIDGRVK